MVFLNTPVLSKAKSRLHIQKNLLICVSYTTICYILTLMDRTFYGRLGIDNITEIMIWRSKCTVFLDTTILSKSNYILYIHGVSEHPRILKVHIYTKTNKEVRECQYIMVAQNLVLCWTSGVSVDVILERSHPSVYQRILDFSSWC